MSNLVRVDPDLFHDLKDIRNVIQNSYRERRNYNKQGKVKKPSVARYKFKITFRDGNERIMYSLDFHCQKYKPEYHDEYESLDNIINYFNKSWNDIDSCCIWANVVDEWPKTNEKRYSEEIYVRWRHQKTGAMEVRVEPKFIQFEIRNGCQLLKLHR